MYTATTAGIRVTVIPMYLDDHSSPDDNHYVWAYNVNIENQGEQPVRLLNRYWHITDAYGRIHEVRGPGVVGEQPHLLPGQGFEYTSGTSLKTPSGIMQGNYDMVREDGNHLAVEIPPFSLDLPNLPKARN